MRGRLAFPRLIIKLALTIMLLLAGAVTLIHTQPFDDGGFQASFFANTCTLPCFMGIQPGITTAAEASDLLEKHGLVHQWIRPLYPDEQPIEGVSFDLLRWRWSNNRPTLLTDTEASLTYDRKTGVVITFGDIGTRLILGNMLIALGQPSMGYMRANFNDRDGATFTHAAGYPQWQLNLVSNIQCPMSVRQLWDSTVTLEIAPTIDVNASFTKYPDHIQAILGYAAHTIC